MSIVNGRRRDTGRRTSLEQIQRAEALPASGPVTVLQGPTKPLKTLRQATTCAACGEVMEAGAAWRFRKLGFSARVCHVSCEVAGRPRT